MSEIPKAYEPQNVEAKWYDFWLKEKCFVADPKSSRPAYTIVIPPPNVTGVLHMGHILNNTIQDILIRCKRMAGRKTLCVPGTYHAGIATQNVVERHLAAQGKKREDLGREAFVAEVWKGREKNGAIIIRQVQ